MSFEANFQKRAWLEFLQKLLKLQIELFEACRSYPHKFCTSYNLAQPMRRNSYIQLRTYYTATTNCTRLGNHIGPQGEVLICLSFV